MSTEAVIAELLASKEPLRILVLGSEGDIKRLAALGLPVTSEDSSLSMQHLVNARLDAERRQGSAGVVQVLTVMPETEQATAAECALIYAMLVRCRKVISVNDGDAQMINELRQMFSDISLSLLAPDIVLAGNIAGDEKLAVALELYKTKTKVIEVC